MRKYGNKYLEIKITLQVAHKEKNQKWLSFIIGMCFYIFYYFGKQLIRFLFYNAELFIWKHPNLGI